MDFPVFVARRYFFSKKSHNVINIISSISLVGVTVCTMSLIIVLSIFNGFDGLIKSVFSTFDPDVKITVNQGKVFDPGTPAFDSIRALSDVSMVCGTLEENVLLEYDQHIHPAVIKGVPADYKDLTGVDTMVREGKFILNDGHRDMAVIGWGVSYYLSVGLSFVDPIKIYVPKRTGKISMNPERAFNQSYIYPSGIFSIQQEIDNKYILVPIQFTRQLLDYPIQVSAMEIKLKPGADKTKACQEIARIAGNQFTIKNQYQQHELLYRVMKSEKFAIYLILTFILIIGSFNMIGSLSMLVIDKKNDISTLRNLGLDKKRLQRIFIFEGWIISIGGAFIGLILGAIVCWGQQTFGFLKLDNMGSFLVSNYPVRMEWADFAIVLVTVILIGLIASWYPVKYFTNRYLSEF
jgi:lipoprotein-releasing system permease protein